MSGCVTLVGAGPGDPGLLTLKGKEALDSAQVVVYDALVGPEILAQMPETAEKIDVGKRAAHHKMAQEDINKLLLEKAREGKRVVRLKGGDPYLFGRGGEELELLCKHKIPFQVIPGVTSALAVPGYAGIPVTHRDFASAVHLITGHAREGKELDINFQALVAAGGTLVFLMGVSSLPSICKGLTDAGMPPDTPASIVEKGTTPHQRRLDGTVATLAQRAAEEGVQAPAVSVFGPVCALGEKFDWHKKLPLNGKTVLVTRPKERAGTLSKRLRELGAEVVEYPCIATTPISPNPHLEAALDQLSAYQWLTLTSPTGVEILFKSLENRGWDCRGLGNLKVAAIGSGTAKALKNYGILADFVPEIYDAAHLGQGLAKLCTGKVLILRAELGSPELTAPLAQAGVGFDDIPTYRTVYENPRSQDLRKKLEEGKIDLVTFTSASTVKGFVSSVGEDLDFSRVLGVCIGAQTEREAKKYKIRTKVAKKATIDSLIECIKGV